jgi:hypothetical protein
MINTESAPNIVFMKSIHLLKNGGTIRGSTRSHKAHLARHLIHKFDLQNMNKLMRLEAQLYVRCADGRAQQKPPAE